MVVGLLQEIHEQDRQNQSAHIDTGWRRTGVRFHPVEHPAFESDVDIIAGTAGALLSHVMVPKVESVADVDRAVLAIDAAMVRGHQVRKDVLPLHVLLESSAAVHRVFDIAQHPRVQSISFGLMDFVSSHGGAIPESAMRVESQNSYQDLGQFRHPLVVRAKLEIAAACHAHGKVPSHCVVTEFADVQAMRLAAQRACREFGYTRMWSIHPSQIRPILEAMAPTEADVEQAAAIIEAAATAHWAPVNYKNQLHDRASYRYFWHILERAHSTGRVLPNSMWAYFNTQPNPTH
jgi:citrate lyase subunit beta/citryl-CoA lyase